ncbi:MAG TPA: ferredoxin [bacterium]|nr:ferredoxin [bacterium]
MSKRKPSAEEKRYRIIFEGRRCIGTGKCAELSGNWEMNLTTGLAKPRSYFINEEELDHNLAAARACPARKGKGVIYIIDRETGEVLYPEPGESNLLHNS